MKISFANFIVKQCNTSHMEEILDIQREAFADLPSTNILRENTPQMIEECLKPPHLTVGAWYDGVLVAFTILYYPHDESEDLAHLLNSVDISGLKTANYKLCIVRKNFRGNSLQYRLWSILERYAIDAGVKLFCVTASPENRHSIDNIVSLGFIYNKTLNKYGFERNLYYKIISG